MSTYDLITHNFDELYHHGIKGQKWGVRRYQNPDGTLTEAGKKRYGRLGSDPNNLRWVDKTAMRRAASKQIYFGTKKIGKNQQKVLDEYRKEANSLDSEKLLNKLDAKGKELKAEYQKKKANGTWMGENDPLAKSIINFQQEYGKARRENSIASRNLAQKYVSRMNEALVKDLDFEHVSVGADYLNNNHLGWDLDYVYNKAWFGIAY